MKRKRFDTLEEMFYGDKDTRDGYAISTPPERQAYWQRRDAKLLKALPPRPVRRELDPEQKCRILTESQFGDAIVSKAEIDAAIAAGTLPETIVLYLGPWGGCVCYGKND